QRPRIHPLSNTYWLVARFLHKLSRETLEKLMKVQVYLEVTNKKTGDAKSWRTSITSPARKPTTKRLPLLYHTIGYRGRLTYLQKVSLPLCKRLPLRYQNLMSRCNKAALPHHLVFFIQRSYHLLKLRGDKQCYPKSTTKKPASCFAFG